MVGPLTDAYAVVVVAIFAGGAALDAADRRDAARLTTAGGWLAFGGFWALLVPHFAFEQRSIVEGVLSGVAVPACAYVGYLLANGRESLLPLSRGVAVMGLLYLPFELSATLARPLIHLVVLKVEAIVGALGYEPTMIQGSTAGQELGLENSFMYVREDGNFATEVVLACTGIGSISIFAGLVAAVDAPRNRKFRALAFAVPVIYVLNVLRVTFISLAHGNQWFAYEPIEGPVMALFGVSNVNRVSYLVSDRIISQSLSVVALVGIALVMVRVLPELFQVFDEVLYVLTRREYDLAGALGVESDTDRPASTTDGGRPNDATDDGHTDDATGGGRPDDGGDRPADPEPGED
jgi:archaeosortase A (PGF-CTERM-specific)